MLQLYARDLNIQIIQSGFQDVKIKFLDFFQYHSIQMYFFVILSVSGYFVSYAEDANRSLVQELKMEGKAISSPSFSLAVAIVTILKPNCTANVAFSMTKIAFQKISGLINRRFCP